MLSRASSDGNISIPANRLMIVTAILAKNAVQKPEILNPGTSVDTRSIIRALMTSKKKPNVTSVNGIVKTMTTGLITALAKPNNNAEISRDFLFSNEIP